MVAAVHTSHTDSLSAFSIRVPIAKRDERAGIVYGWAAISTDADGVLVVDHDNEYIPIEELESAAHDLFARGSGTGMGAAMHETMAVADLVASMPLDAAKRAAFGFGQGVEGWIVGLKINDPDTRARVFSGEWPELSIRGTAVGVEVEKLAGASTSPRRYRKLTKLRISDIEAVSFVDRGASGNQNARPRIVLAKRENPMAEPKNQEVKKEVTGLAVIAELLESGALAKLDEEKKAALLALIGGKPPENAPTPAPPIPDMEGMPEEAKKAYKVQAEQVTALAKRNADLEEQVAKMRDKVDHGELVEFVKRDLSHLPTPDMKIDDVAKMIGGIRRNLGSESAAKVEAVLKSASEAIRKGTSLRSVGHDGGNDSSGSSAESQLMARADEFQKADPKLSRSDALTKARKTYPDLNAEYVAKRRNAG